MGVRHAGACSSRATARPGGRIVHIEDIARAFLAVLDAPRELVHNEAFNVGQTEENYRIRELADIVRDVVPGSQIEYAKDGGPDQRCYRVDFGKIQRLLPEFKPQWTARRGARRALRCLPPRRASSIEDCEGPRFKRIDHLKYACWRTEPGGRDASLDGTRVGRASAELSVLRRTAAAYLRRSRHVAAVRELPRRPTSSTRWSRSIRCTSASASECFLVQLEEYVRPEDIFTEYAYFSSYSDSWLAHARALRRR